MNSSADPDSFIIGQLILIAFLTLLNAFFAASEMALVSLNKNRIAHLAGEGNKKAILLEKLIDGGWHDLKNNGPTQGFLTSSVNGTVKAAGDRFLNHELPNSLRCMLKWRVVAPTACRTAFAGSSIPKIFCRAPKATQARHERPPKLQRRE